MVGGIDKKREVDLVIMDSLSKNSTGYKYILTVIDVLSKYAWVEEKTWLRRLRKSLKKGGNLRNYIPTGELSLPTNFFKHF